MLLRDVIRHLDWSPAKGSPTGFSPGQVGFKISAVVTEDRVLRLLSSMENTEEGGKISYASPRCSVFLRQKKSALLHGEPQGFWTVHAEMPGQRVSGEQRLAGALAARWEFGLLKFKLCICSAAVGSVCMCRPLHPPLPGISPYL